MGIFLLSRKEAKRNNYERMLVIVTVKDSYNQEDWE